MRPIFFVILLCSAVAACHSREAASPSPPAPSPTKPMDAVETKMRAMIPGLRASCARGEVNPCEVLADILAQGIYGEARDVAKAKEHYTTACNGGSQLACKKMNPSDRLYQLKER